MAENFDAILNLEVGKEYFIKGKLNKKAGKDKKGNKFYHIKITDDLGSVFGKITEKEEIFVLITDLKDDTTVEALIEVKNAEKYYLVNFKEIKLPKTEFDTLIEKINEIEHEELKKLCLNILSKEDIKNNLLETPATQKSGYSYEKGLIKHILRMIELSKTISDFINDNSKIKINKDLLITASIIHDLGKIKSLNINSITIDKTKEGILFEDTYLSIKLLLEELNNVNLNEHEKMMLEHIIGSSKEQTSFGALFIPRTIEAIVFSIIEKLDTQIANFEFMNEKANGSLYQLFQKVYCIDTFATNYTNNTNNTNKTIEDDELIGF